MEPETLMLLAMGAVLPFALLVALAFRSGEKAERGFWVQAATDGHIRRTPDGSEYIVACMEVDRDGNYIVVDDEET